MAIIPTKLFEAFEANQLSIEVGSNCPQGGDAGHGGRTVLKLKDEGNTNFRVHIRGHDGSEGEVQDCSEVTLIFSGDSERQTLLACLEYAVKVLKEPSTASGEYRNEFRVD